MTEENRAGGDQVEEAAWRTAKPVPQRWYPKRGPSRHVRLL